jgi:hypothetical protein
VGDLSASPCGPLIRDACVCVCVLLTWQLTAPIMSDPGREPGAGCNVFDGLILVVTSCHFLHVLFIASVALSSEHIQGKDNEFPSLKKRRIK